MSYKSIKVNFYINFSKYFNQTTIEQHMKIVTETLFLLIHTFILHHSSWVKWRKFICRTFATYGEGTAGNCILWKLINFVILWMETAVKFAMWRKGRFNVCFVGIAILHELYYDTTVPPYRHCSMVTYTRLSRELF